MLSWHCQASLSVHHSRCGVVSVAFIDYYGDRWHVSSDEMVFKGGHSVMKMGNQENII